MENLSPFVSPSLSLLLCPQEYGGKYVNMRKDVKNFLPAWGCETTFFFPPLGLLGALELSLRACPSRPCLSMLFSLSFQTQQRETLENFVPKSQTPLQKVAAPYVSYKKQYFPQTYLLTIHLLSHSLFETHSQIY